MISAVVVVIMTIAFTASALAVDPVTVAGVVHGPDCSTCRADAHAEGAKDERGKPPCPKIAPTRSACHPQAHDHPVSEPAGVPPSPKVTLDLEEKAVYELVSSGGTIPGGLLHIRALRVAVDVSEVLVAIHNRPKAARPSPMEEV